MWFRHVNYHTWDNSIVTAGLATTNRNGCQHSHLLNLRLSLLCSCVTEADRIGFHSFWHTVCVKECFGSSSRSFNTAATKNRAWCIRKTGHFDLLPITSYVYFVSHRRMFTTTKLYLFLPHAVSSFGLITRRRQKMYSTFLHWKYKYRKYNFIFPFVRAHLIEINLLRNPSNNFWT